MKLLATDLDGTLIQNEAISEFNFMALHAWRQQGNKIAIATGRPLVATTHLKQAVNYDYAITANGSLVTDHLGNVIFRKIIDFEVVNAIVDLISETDYFCLVSDGYQFISLTDYKLNPIKDILFISVTPNSQQEADILPLYELFTNRFNNDASFVCNKYHLDVGGFGCTKATAINEIVKNEGITNQDVHVFGDHDNDISMFEAYENSYFILGGSEKLRKLATNEIEAVSDAIDFYHPFDVQ